MSRRRLPAGPFGEQVIELVEGLDIPLGGCLVNEWPETSSWLQLESPLPAAPVLGEGRPERRSQTPGRTGRAPRLRTNTRPAAAEPSSRERVPSAPGTVALAVPRKARTTVHTPSTGPSGHLADQGLLADEFLRQKRPGGPRLYQHAPAASGVEQIDLIRLEGHL